LLEGRSVRVVTFAVFAGLVTLPAVPNEPPRLNWRTNPAANMATQPFPTVSGKAPLTVTFNLCNADDPDSADSLNWQFHFGDSPFPPFNSNGTFNPDMDHTCRVEHTYKAGTYTATLSVTDKHLEDQSRDVRSTARTTVVLRIQANEADAAPAPTAQAGPACGGGNCVVFLTSTVYFGNMGGAPSGIAGGDAQCNLRAAAVGLPGTFKAWLSDGGSVSPSTSFTQSSGPYVRTDGLVVASNWADLTDLSLLEAINRDEFGTVSAAGFAWSGGSSNGGQSPVPGYVCLGWTSASPANNGMVGQIGTSAQWGGVANALGYANNCDTPRPLYCFQQ